MDQQTLQFYQQRSREWASALPYDYSPGLDAFLDQLAADATILELGCGDGRDAAHMLARGFADIHPSDGSPEMARLASERLGRPVAVMRFEELDEIARYDAAWCHASLLHVHEADLPGILGKVNHALKPGGLFCASFKGGEGGHRDEFGRYYCYLSTDRLREAYFEQRPWSEYRCETSEGGSFGGTATIWHHVTARK